MSSDPRPEAGPPAPPPRTPTGRIVLVVVVVVLALGAFVLRVLLPTFAENAP